MLHMRYYYKCSDCIGVWAVNGELISGIICDCNGTWKTMGRVQDNRLVEEKECSVCDCRCTRASGPLCNCICRGVNHGSGRTVLILKDVSGIPKPQGLMENKQERMQIANQWRQIVSMTENAINSQTDYYKRYKLQETLRKAKTYKLHTKRMESLMEVLKTI